MYNRPQKLVAEFVGTFALIFMGVGSICADQFIKASGNPSGLGLLGMEERVRRLGGVFTLDSEPGRGTRLSVELPLPSSQ